MKNKYPKKIKLEDINNYPLICKYGVSNSRHFLENYLSEKNQNLEVRYNLSNHNLIEKYVDEGLGIGLVTRQIVKDKIDKGEYSEVKTDIELPKRKIVYVIRKNGKYSKIINEFINKIQSYKD